MGFFVIFLVRTPQLSPKLTTKCGFRLNSDFFVQFFDNFVQICSLSAIHNQFAFVANEKVQQCVNFLPLGVVLVGKNLPTAPD